MDQRLRMTASVKLAILAGTGVLVAVAIGVVTFIGRRDVHRPEHRPLVSLDWMLAEIDKLETDPAHPRHLITEPGMGYRFRP